MSIVDMAMANIDELRDIIANIVPEHCEKLEKEICGAKRIFVAAAGRSLLAMKFFAMRLMQLGFTSYIVGEVCTPSIQKGDVLIIGSGSGETQSIHGIAQKAKCIGARIAVLTKNDQSSIAALANSVVKLNTPDSIREGSATSEGQIDSDYRSIRPSGNPFEQSIVIFTDALICSLMYKMGRGTDYIAANHANLE
jgi:6-phospho-3-hexuloisomerase